MSDHAQDLLDALTNGRPAPPPVAPEDLQETQEEAGIPAFVPSSTTEREPERPPPIFGDVPVLGIMNEVGALDDIGEGVIEAPVAIAGGMIDAVNEALQFGSEGMEDSLRGLGELFGASDELDQFLAENPPAQLPNFDNPDTRTGNAIRSISQFVLPFSKVSGALRAVGLGAQGTRTGAIANATVSGAVADAVAFDPHEERLGNLIQSVPELENPITEFLAADPDDTAAMGRLKNTLEGLGLGVGTDLLLNGLRAFRGLRSSRDQQVAEATTRNDAEMLLGDPERELVEPGMTVTITPEPRPGGSSLPDTPNVTPQRAEEAVEDPEVFINFGRIDTAEDVETVIQRLADEDISGVTAAQRGVQSNEETARLADDMDMDVDDLLARRDGQPFNAEQAVAARRLWVSSAERLQQIAREASVNPSDANLYAFRRMLTVHTAVQRSVIGARTETARALQSWRIPAGGSAESMDAISRTINSFGGSGVTRDMAKAISEAGLTPAQLGKIAAGSLGVRSYRAFHELWINGLLSNPPTHIVNGVSNLAVGFLSMFERRVAGSIARVLGDKESVALGEAVAQLHGTVSGLKDGMRAMIDPDSASAVGTTLNKIDTPYEASITGRAFGAENIPWMARGIDVLGWAIRTPGRALESSDRFFKAIAYRSEVQAQSVRQATREVNAGEVSRDMYRQRVAELTATPPESIRMEATNEAYYRTFTQAAGPKTQAIMGIRNKIPGMAFILPFIRTPSNILHFTLSRTPLAPLIREFRADIAAGGARRDVALARMAIGTGAVLTAMDLSMSGHITGNGPADRGQRSALLRTGWQPYSIRMGDEYIQYSRMDPIGTLLGLGADMSEIFLNTGVPGQTSEQQSTVAAVLASVANVFMNKTYLTGLADLVRAVEEPERRAQSYLNRFVGSVIPAVAAGVTRSIDPYLRVAQDMTDSLRRRTPGLSDELPISRDLWGRPISFRSEFGSVYDWISPIRVSTDDPLPIDTEMLRLGHTPLRPSAVFTMNSVRFDLKDNPALYQRYIQLAGEPAAAFLNSIISGEHPRATAYERMPDELKIDFIDATLRRYRELARVQLLQTEPDMRTRYQQELNRIASERP